MKIALFAFAALALATIALASRVPLQPDQPGAEAVVDNSDFMEILMKSSYAELQDAVAHRPADRKAWATAYQRAVRLAEISNLLFIRNRPEARDPRWKDAAANVRRIAADLASAALVGLRNTDAADYTAVRAKYESLSSACNSCHRTFSREAPTIRP